MALRRLVKAAFVFFVSACVLVAVRGFLAPAARGPGVDAVELARHASPADCWLAVDGGVFDVTAYLSSHPAPEGLIEPWCGKDASAPFADKGIGRPHSPEARRALETYRVGVFRP